MSHNDSIVNAFVLLVDDDGFLKMIMDADAHSWDKKLGNFAAMIDCGDKRQWYAGGRLRTLKNDS